MHLYLYLYLHIHALTTFQYEHRKENVVAVFVLDDVRFIPSISASHSRGSSTSNHLSLLQGGVSLLEN